MKVIEGFSEQQMIRLRAYQQMTAYGKKVARKFVNIERRAAELEVLTRYDIAVELNLVAGQPGTYGSAAMEQLAVAMGQSASQLNAMRNFATRFSRELVEQTVRRRTVDGRHLTYRHFLVLASLESEAERNARLEQMFTNPMGACQLDRELKALGVEKTKRRSRGRKPEFKPSSPLGRRVDMAKRFGTINRRAGMWETFVFDAFDQMPSDRLSERHVEQLRRSLEMVVEAREPVAKLYEKLRAALDRCQRIIAERDPVAAIEHSAGPVYEPDDSTE